MAETLTIQPATLAAVLPLLEKAASKADTTGGSISIAELCAGSIPFEVTSGAGLPIAAYTIAKHGRTCWIMAAAGNAPGISITDTLLPVMERQARELGAEQIAITTRRPGLVKRLQDRHGYEQTGVTLRKRLTQ